MASHEMRDENGDANVPKNGDAHCNTGQAGESNVKRRVRHARHASVENHHEWRGDLPQSGPETAQRRKKLANISQQQHTRERQSSDVLSNRLPSPPADIPSPEGVVAGPKLEDARMPFQPHDETVGDAHHRERPKRSGPRRGSPRRLMSPNRRSDAHQRPHAMDFMVDRGESEELSYFSPQSVYQGGSVGQNPRVHAGCSPIQRLQMMDVGREEPIFDGYCPQLPPSLPPPGPSHHAFNRFGSPEAPGFYPQPQGPPFPADLAMPPTLPALPPPERQLTGYELLAAKLAGDVAGPKLAPIYRRFESLHHRLLLHLQDELAQLESQLDELDAQDAHHKMFSGNGPRRKERNSHQDTGWRMKETLSQIAQKLYQYHQAVASFQGTQNLGEPTVAEAYGYRTYVENFAPEVLEAFNFLDAPDLVSLSKRRSATAETTDVGLVGFPPTNSPPSDAGSHRSSRRPHVRAMPSPAPARAQVKARKQLAPVNHGALALGAIVLAPILAFSIIHDFIGRMTLVVLVGAVGAAAMMQSGFLSLTNDRGAVDFFICAGVYGAVMSIIAGVVS